MISNIKIFDNVHLQFSFSSSVALYFVGLTHFFLDNEAFLGQLNSRDKGK